MRFFQKRIVFPWISIGLFVTMLGILPGYLTSDGNLWGQEEDEPEPSTGALSKAKRTLQEMGMRLGDNLGQVGNLRDMKFAFSVKISDSQKALSKGFGLAEPRPTPVKSGTSLSIVIDANGKITFFINSQNKLLDSQNQSTSIALNKSVIPSEVVVSNSAFPPTIK